MKTVTINDIEYPVYADVADSDKYFNASFGSSWENISIEDKSKLLVSATRTIDRNEWRGVPVDEQQELAFPRMICGKQTDDNLLMKACCEEAQAIHKSGTSEYTDNQGIETIRVQDTQITFKANAEEKQFKSEAVEDLLRPYMYLGVSVLY